MKDLTFLIGELKSGDDQRAEAAVHKIHEHGDAALPFLSPLLESPDADLRWWATWAIAGFRSPETTILLRERLRDPDPTVRQGAALGLRQQPDKEAIPDLIACLDDEDPTLVHLSAAALAAIGEEAVPVLLELLDRATLSTRLEILRALAAIGDERSIPALFQALDDESALVEHWASEGLEKMGVGMQFFKP
jgi:HEAT repeat protein